MSASDRKICHLTTVHPRFDNRIFYKECLSLAAEYNVYLIVADGKGNEVKNGIQIIDVLSGRKSRINRFFFTTRRAYKKALEIDCDLYHFHDAEFLFYGCRLKRNGKKVVYDVHEDLPKQVLSKSYINPVLRKILSRMIMFFEKKISSELSAVITATPNIYNRFSKLNSRCQIINNYPKFEEFGAVHDKAEKKNEICYIGSITKVRGIEELIESIENIDVSLNLAGNFESESFKARLMNKPGWKKVNYLGFISPGEAYRVMLRSFAGICTLHPEPNYLDSQATKIFEYMYAGIPVIASDFPAWKEFVEHNKCGICVNPRKASSISSAIRFFKDNPDKAEEMGKNGNLSVRVTYSWATEERKLRDLYSSILA